MIGDPCGVFGQIPPGELITTIRATLVARPGAGGCRALLLMARVAGSLSANDIGAATGHDPPANRRPTSVSRTFADA